MLPMKIIVVTDDIDKWKNYFEKILKNCSIHSFHNGNAYCVNDKNPTYGIDDTDQLYYTIIIIKDELECLYRARFRGNAAIIDTSISEENFAIYLTATKTMNYIFYEDKEK